MKKVVIGTTMSLDGFIADRKGDLSPLYPDLAALQQSEMLQEEIRTTGAVIMGRRTYNVAQGDLTGYEFQVPVFVLTHHPPKKAPKGQNENLKVFFVTDGIESVVNKAKAAAGDREVLVIGGVDVSRQILDKRLANELSIGIAPIVLGEGLRFFDGFDWKGVTLERTAAQPAGGAVYLHYRLVLPPQRKKV
jgi:dihydrofolate reductase